MKHIASFVAAVGFAAFLAVGQTAAGQETFSGKVVETMAAGTYTYVLVDTGTNKVWAAGPQCQVNKGDSVTVPGAMQMQNFPSKSLNRVFPVIYFAGSIQVNGASSETAKLPPGHPAIGGSTNAGGQLPPNHPPVAGMKAAAPIDFAGLKPAKGGKTVAEVIASRAALAGKTVSIRGKVVKYNAEIMGKNWLHIQDGTGTAGGNDLLVTSANTAKRGDTVLIEGRVAVNQDFGSGYKYDVLVDNAKVTVE